MGDKSVAEEYMFERSVGLKKKEVISLRNIWAKDCGSRVCG